MRFALLEAKLALASIIQRYHLTPSDKTADVLEQDPKTVMPYAKGGLHIKLERRNWDSKTKVSAITWTCQTLIITSEVRIWFNSILQYLLSSCICYDIFLYLLE